MLDLNILLDISPPDGSAIKKCRMVIVSCCLSTLGVSECQSSPRHRGRGVKGLRECSSQHSVLCAAPFFCERFFGP